MLANTAVLRFACWLILIASSIMGTIQNTVAASSAIIGAAIYDGSVRNSIMILASSATLIVLVFLLKPIICPAPLVHHPDEFARA